MSSANSDSESVSKPPPGEWARRKNRRHKRCGCSGAVGGGPAGRSPAVCYPGRAGYVGIWLRLAKLLAHSLDRPQRQGANDGISGRVAVGEVGGRTAPAGYFLDDRSVAEDEVYGVDEVSGWLGRTIRLICNFLSALQTQQSINYQGFPWAHAVRWVPFGCLRVGAFVDHRFRMPS